MKPNRNHLPTLLASFENLDGHELELVAGTPDAVELELEAQGDAGVPRFRMIAYTGAAMRFPHLSPHPVIVDLEGITAAGDPLPIFRDHDPAQRVGHGSIRVEAGRLVVEGVMSGAGKAADETRAEAKRGFPFQASIGAKVVRAEFVRKGRRASVNGRNVVGPVVIARRAELFEVSWVSLGRDSGTSSRLAAQARKGRNMKDFENWLEGLGFEASELTESQRENLLATYNRENPGAAGGDRSSVALEDEARKVGDDLIRAERERVATERERIATIGEICGDEHASIAAEAIRAGWGEDKTRLEVLKAERGTSDVHVARRGSTAQAAPDSDVLEAAALVSLGYDDDATVRAFSTNGRDGERIVDTARAKFSGIGLMGLALEAAKGENRAPGNEHDTDAVIRAGVSTSSLSSVISNVVSKIAMRVYENHPIVALSLCSVRNVPDYKSVEGYRLDGSGRWEAVGKGGRLEHGKLSDTAYKNKAELYGQTIGIDYRDFANDDLAILNATGRLMGMQGASLIDHLFATRLLGNSDMDGNTFFSAGNGNLQTGAGTAFGLAGLSAARTAFRKIKAGPGTKAKDQRPINVRPKTLLVPPELETDAEQILNSVSVNLTGSTDNEKADANPWRDKYGLSVLPHLSDSAYTGNSAAAWYLMADPALVPALELVFVQGRTAPTIERVPAASDELGLRYRGHLSVGCNFTDPKGAQKMAGS